MAQTGDWVTPRLYGQPWFEKPILYYGRARLAFRLNFPRSGRARCLCVRRPRGCAGDRMARLQTLPRRYRRGPLAPVLFATTVGAIGFSRAATPDMLFSAILALAMAAPQPFCGTRASARRRTSAKIRDCVPLILCSSADSWLRRSRQRARGNHFGRRRPRASGQYATNIGAPRRNSACSSLRLSSFCVVALPWYVLCRCATGFSPRLHPPAQFRALPHARLSAPSTVLVFHPHHASRAASLDRSALARRPGRNPPLARKVLERFAGLLFRLLGCLSCAVLQFFPIQAAELHSAAVPPLRSFAPWRSYRRDHITSGGQPWIWLSKRDWFPWAHPGVVAAAAVHHVAESVRNSDRGRRGHCIIGGLARPRLRFFASPAQSGFYPAGSVFSRIRDSGNPSRTRSIYFRALARATPSNNLHPDRSSPITCRERGTTASLFILAANCRNGLRPTDPALVLTTPRSLDEIRRAKVLRGSGRKLPGNTLRAHRTDAALREALAQWERDAGGSDCRKNVTIWLS